MYQNQNYRQKGKIFYICLRFHLKDNKTEKGFISEHRRNRFWRGFIWILFKINMLFPFGKLVGVDLFLFSVKPVSLGATSILLRWFYCIDLFCIYWNRSSKSRTKNIFSREKDSTPFPPIQISPHLSITIFH